jgi:hypothetical protein
VISARLDSDGVAATRDSEDLVGRAVLKQPPPATATPNAAGEGAAPWPQVTVPLQGRGFGGKLVTAKTAPVALNP